MAFQGSGGRGAATRSRRSLPQAFANPVVALGNDERVQVVGQDGSDARAWHLASKRPGAARAMVGWYRAAIRDGLRHPLSAPRYPSIAVETLLIWGLNDVAFDHDVPLPGTGRYVRYLEIKRLAGCGHFVPSERPDDVNRLLIDFLKR